MLAPQDLTYLLRKGGMTRENSESHSAAMARVSGVFRSALKSIWPNRISSILELGSNHIWKREGLVC